jgi:hypothetical protein
VEAGTPVVDVSAPTLVEAAARHAAARRRLEVHKARRRELGELRAQGLANATQVFELDSTIAELEAERTHAEAILHAAGVPTRRFEAVARSGRITLSAPVPGVVTEVDARVGEIRDAGGPPFVRITGTAEAIVEVHTMEPWPTSQRLVFVTSDGREIDLDPIPVASVVVPEDGSRRSWYGPSGEPISLPEGLRGIARAAAPADAWEVPVHALRDDTVLRRRGESTGRVPVDVITASGATAWVRPRQSDGLREGDRVASRAPEDAPALDAGAEP